MTRYDAMSMWAKGDEVSKRAAVGAAVLSLALAVMLVGCSSEAAKTTEPAPSTETSTANDQPYVFDSKVMYVGRWHGSVEVSDQASYGEPGTYAQVLTLTLAADGSASVAPSADYPDSGIKASTGTWEGTETEVTLHLDAHDITLTAEDISRLSGNAADFGLGDFDTVQFAYFG